MMKLKVVDIEYFSSLMFFSQLQKNVCLHLFERDTSYGKFVEDGL